MCVCVCMGILCVCGRVQERKEQREKREREKFIFFFFFVFYLFCPFVTHFAVYKHDPVLAVCLFLVPQSHSLVSSRSSLSLSNTLSSLLWSRLFPRLVVVLSRHFVTRMTVLWCAFLGCCTLLHVRAFYAPARRLRGTIQQLSPTDTALKVNN